jgi:hypothetical protein
MNKEKGRIGNRIERIKEVKRKEEMKKKEKGKIGSSEERDKEVINK